MTEEKSVREVRKNRCVRFTDSEWSEVRQLAIASGHRTSTADYIRTVSLRPLRAPRVESDTANELIRQLRKIGINLNQLTRLANTGRTDIADDLRQALDQINEAVTRIR